ncbi:MAG: flagellar export protein FliJ [Gemmatimonadales bacterium]|nr:flagellar export protein FliJ [Gemmatimonadales bacterium]
MAFRFRLEKVLKHRQRLADRQAREVAFAVRRVSEISERIRNLDGEIHSFESSFPTTQLQVSIQERINMVRWIEHLRSQQTRLENNLSEAQCEKDAQQEKMTSAWQDLEVLKKLKAHQKESWLEENRKRENLEMDEVGIQRSDRKRREKLASV